MVGMGHLPCETSLPALPCSQHPTVGPASSSAEEVTGPDAVWASSGPDMFFKGWVVCSSTDPQSRDHAFNPFWVPKRPCTWKQNNPLSYSPACPIIQPTHGSHQPPALTFSFKVIKLTFCVSNNLAKRTYIYTYITESICYILKHLYINNTSIEKLEHTLFLISYFSPCYQLPLVDLGSYVY